MNEVRALASHDLGGALAVLAEARLVGRATPSHLYLEAQLLSRRGSHEEALTLIDTAETAFRELGDELGAARCDAGRSNVLEDLGRHDHAVSAARRWLSWLEAAPDTTDERRVLLAQAQTNLGVRLEDAGDYLGALAAHDAAIAAMLAEGDEAMAASMQINRANVLNLLGRSREAFAGLSWAAAVFERTGETEDLAVAAINAGESLCRLGRPDDGLKWFTQADQLLPEASPDRAVLLVETADALAALGALEEAARRYDDAFADLAATPLAWLEVRAWTGAGRVAGELGRVVEAAEALTEASTRHFAAGNQPGWAVTESEALVLLPPDTPGRRARIDALVDVIADIDATRWPVQACQTHLNLATLTCDNPHDAEQHLRIAAALAERSGVPQLEVRAGQRLGDLLWRTGRADEAGRVLEGVLRVAERVRGRLHVEELLRAFPVTVEAAYTTLVEVWLAAGRVADAFELADAGRARAIAELGSASAADAAGVSADADAELGAIYDRLLSRDGSLTTAVRRQLDERANQLEADIDRVQLDAVRTSRRRAAGSVPVPDGELQLLYQISGGRVGMFVRSRHDTTFHPDVADLAGIADDLAAFHSVGRRALALAARDGDRVEQLTVTANAHLRRLGARLLGPISDHLDRTERLVVVPHQGLHGVPFHALSVDGSTMLDHVEVTVTPSLSIRRSRPPSRSGPTLLVGHISTDLPGVNLELDALQGISPDAVVLRDEEATIAAVTAAMDGAAWIHLASHGIFRQNAPMASGVRLADGWLSARHTSHLDLAGATVVLSACNTGRSVVRAGDELVGLQRGFLLAGARGVVLTHWSAVDSAAVITMTEFHRAHRAGYTVPAALRAAWILTRERHPHPWWWAPFFASAL